MAAVLFAAFGAGFLDGAAFRTTFFAAAFPEALRTDFFLAGLPFAAPAFFLTTFAGFFPAFLAGFFTVFFAGFFAFFLVAIDTSIND